MACAQVHAKAQTDSGRIEEDEPAGGAGGGGQLTVFQSELLEAHAPWFTLAWCHGGIRREHGESRGTAAGDPVVEGAVVRAVHGIEQL